MCFRKEKKDKALFSNGVFQKKRSKNFDGKIKEIKIKERQCYKVNERVGGC